MSTPPISQLCKNCSLALDIDLLLDHNPINNKGYRPYDTDKELYRFQDTWPELPGLAASGESGCGLCKLIRDTFASQPPSTEYKGPITGLVSRSATSIQVEPRKVLDYTVMIHDETRSYKALEYARFLPCSDDDSMPFLRPPLTKVLSEETLNFTKKSIDQCASTCHPWEPSGSTPARLIDMGEYKATGRIKLIQTKGLPRVKYAALSYCWGNADDAAYQPKTNSVNLSERLGGFGIDVMSPVVRDAIMTCEALGMRYLWVDALCILQGKADIADWDVESQKMTDVYRNAYVTLCPSSSNSCREGFLDKRQRHPGIWVKTPITSNAVFQNESREFSIIPYEIKEISNAHAFTYEITDSKWYSRAWVWQEVNFSARLVIFCPTFVFFRCPEMMICENGARKETTYVQKGLGEFHSKLWQDAQPYAFFRTCVENISVMDISFESDRLAAIAGVAKQVSQATGMNRETLELDGGDWECEYTYLDVTTETVGDNPFGQVSRGSLTITTKMASLAEIAALHDGDDGELIKEMLFTPQYRGQVACGIEWNWDVDNEETPVHLADKILVVAISSCLYELRSEIRNLYGLMVYPAEKEGQYYRVGSFEAQSAADDDEDNHEDTGVLITEEWEEKSIVII
ncbi:hypothetical protein FGADI_7567 [Fusarium gaditjirri]|uniref:Heterokaryon incompatibility domain-containing protein n=1 Tax=Fusarium gaditjirri TaxID=282569 RepID=A0A8H4T508_9HYPO|nr:hypothetical protein FGADI_7567 [Fusarium gaditjirri]